MCEQSYVREKLNALLDTGVSRKDIMKAIGLHAANLSRFLSGRQDMSEENINALYSKGVIQKPDEYQIKGIKNRPLQVWHGEVKKIKDVATEKGYSAATIRKWCKEGKLNYIRPKRRYLVVIDEKYNGLGVSEKAQMRNRIEELEARNAQLEAQVEKMQLNFSFDEEESTKQQQEKSFSERAKEKEFSDLKDTVFTKQCEIESLKYDVEDLQKENEQLKNAIEAYQNTITRLTSQNAKDYSQNPFSRKKITSNSLIMCGS